MPTWNDLSVVDPADTEAVSNGASRIRDVVEAGKTTMEVEHYQTGEHNFPTVQPATPLEGQMWFDLVANAIKRFDGTTHNLLNVVPRFFNNLSGLTVIAPTTTYVDIVTVPNVIVPVNGSVVLLASVDVRTTAGSDTGSPVTFPALANLRFQRATTTLTGQRSPTIPIRGDQLLRGATSVTEFAYDATPAAGTYTYRIQVNTVNTVSVTSTAGAILALVI